MAKCGDTVWELPTPHGAGKGDRERADAADSGDAQRPQRSVRYKRLVTSRAKWLTCQP